MTAMINLKWSRRFIIKYRRGDDGKGKTSITGRDSEEEKKGGSSKKVTSTKRKYR